jgi:hypothetical protein
VNVPTEQSVRSADEEGVSRSMQHPHLRLRKPHRTRSALRTLRQELESLYNELTAALLPDGKGRK